MRSGAVRFGAIFALVVVAALLAMPLAQADEPADNSAAILAEIGITPESLALAGLDGEDVGTMRGLIDAASELRLNYSIAKAGVATTAAALTAAREANQRGFEGDPDERLADALASYSTAVGNLEGAADDLYTLVTVGLDDPAQDMLADCRERCHAGLPPEFWVVGITAEDVVELREALVAEKRAIRRSESLPVDISNLLDAYRENPDVEEAVEALEQNLASTRAAMEE